MGRGTEREWRRQGNFILHENKYIKSATKHQNMKGDGKYHGRGDIRGENNMEEPTMYDRIQGGSIRSGTSKKNQALCVGNIDERQSLAGGGWTTYHARGGRWEWVITIEQ